MEHTYTRSKHTPRSEEGSLVNGSAVIPALSMKGPFTQLSAHKRYPVLPTAVTWPPEKSAEYTSIQELKATPTGHTC